MFKVCGVSLRGGWRCYAEMVESTIMGLCGSFPKYGDPPKYYNPEYKDPQKVPLTLGNPHILGWYISHAFPCLTSPELVCWLLKLAAPKPLIAAQNPNLLGGSRGLSK